MFTRCFKFFHGRADAICIEEPGVDGAEFFLQWGGQREHWQAKRQVLNQENWSLQLLKTRGVLDFFLDRLRAGESCVFASISDAPELRVLAENARDAKTWVCTAVSSSVAIGARTSMNSVLLWNNLAELETFDLLLRIRVEGARECTLESLLACVLQVTLTGPPQTALAVFTSPVRNKRSPNPYRAINPTAP